MRSEIESCACVTRRRFKLKGTKENSFDKWAILRLGDVFAQLLNIEIEVIQDA